MDSSKAINIIEGGKNNDTKSERAEAKGKTESSQKPQATVW